MINTCVVGKGAEMHLHNKYNLAEKMLRCRKLKIVSAMCVCGVFAHIFKNHTISVLAHIASAF